MKAAIHDPCFLYTQGMLGPSPPETRGATFLQMDDTFNVGSASFKEKEQQEVKICRHKRAEELVPGTFQAFNCSRINNQAGKLLLNQPLHANGVETISNLETDTAPFISQRTRVAYISSTCRPDLSFLFSKPAQTTTPTEKDTKVVNEGCNKY